MKTKVGRHSSLASGVTRKLVKLFVDRAEARYVQCWEYLSAIKRREFDNNNLECFTKFQPTLADALFELSQFYARIASEKAKTLERKSEFQSASFAARMKRLTEYQAVTTRTISVGKGLGDAFALLFYEKNRSLLSQHLSQPEIFQPPTGIGGKGEHELIRNHFTVGRYLLIAHSLTSVLRLGDVTLIDPRTFGIAGIGELKSKSPKLGILEVSLIASGPGLRSIGKERAARFGDLRLKAHRVEGFTPAANDRLRRQLRRISATFSDSAKRSFEKLTLEGENRIDQLEQAIKATKLGRFNFRKAGDGLLLCVYGERKKSLFSKLSDGKDTSSSTKTIAGVERHALGILNNHRTDNSLIVGSLYYTGEGRTTHLPGMSHLVWWPMDLRTIRSIIFQDVRVVTVYNPVHLKSRFESMGFVVEEVAQSKDQAPRFKVWKTRDGRNIEVEGFAFYLAMITRYLTSEEMIVEMVASAEQKIVDKNLRSSVRAELIVQYFV